MGSVCLSPCRQHSRCQRGGRTQTLIRPPESGTDGSGSPRRNACTGPRQRHTKHQKNWHFITRNIKEIWIPSFPRKQLRDLSWKEEKMLLMFVALVWYFCAIYDLSSEFLFFFTREILTVGLAFSTSVLIRNAFVTFARRVHCKNKEEKINQTKSSFASLGVTQKFNRKNKITLLQKLQF